MVFRYMQSSLPKTVWDSLDRDWVNLPEKSYFTHLPFDQVNSLRWMKLSQEKVFPMLIEHICATCEHALRHPNHSDAETWPLSLYQIIPLVLEINDEAQRSPFRLDTKNKSIYTVCTHGSSLPSTISDSISRYQESTLHLAPMLGCPKKNGISDNLNLINI